MASTLPVIFKRTKSRPTARARQTTPESDKTESVQTTEDETPSILATKLKNKAKRAKPKSNLSFGGDDDESGGEVFQVKKSNLSQKLRLGQHPANIPLNLDQATISSNRGPTYDQAYLNELKASNVSARPAAVSNIQDADIPMDVDDVNMVVDADSLASEAIIPTEGSIKEAKERRERLRKTGTTASEDYISLSVTRRSDEYQGPHPESRLMREEDDLGEGDDEFAEFTSAQERIAIGKKSRKVEASQRRDAMKDLIADAQEEVDEESAEWEQEQLRRGGHIAGDSRPGSPQVKAVYKPAPIPEMTPIPTLNGAMSRLAEQLTLLTTSHASNTSALASLAKEREELDRRETEMRDMVVSAEEKRAWFTSFKEWLDSVADFLDQKYPMLEKLEEEQLSLLQEKRDMVATRRKLEDEDDLSAVYGPLPPEPQADEQQANPALTKAERREARIRRRQARQARNSKQQEEEGFSTDSSLQEEDTFSYSEALKELQSKKKEVLADVKAEEFLDPGKGRWSAWRDKYSDSYIGAYGGLNLVSVWEFWTRLEMVGWNSFEKPSSLDNSTWYHGLYTYCRPGGDDELGPDGDLVASMIVKAVIPKTIAIINSGALDPYSRTHIRRVIDLSEEVEAHVATLEDGEVKRQMLWKSVMSVFEAAVAQTESTLDKFKAISSKAQPFNPEAIPARRRFLARRIKLLRCLLQWRKHTGEKFGLGQLIHRLADNCFIPVARSGWDVGGEELANKVAEAIPNDLMGNGLVSRLRYSG